HQVRGELHAREPKVQRAAQGAHEHGLAEARLALEQDVAARDQRDEHGAHQRLLADDQLGQLGFDVDRQLLEPFWLHGRLDLSCPHLDRSLKYCCTSCLCCSGMSARSTWLSALFLY